MNPGIDRVSGLRVPCQGESVLLSADFLKSETLVNSADPTLVCSEIAPILTHCCEQGFFYYLFSQF